MNIKNIFDRLKAPKDESYFTGEFIDERSKNQIGKDWKSRPVFLIDTNNYDNSYDSSINLENLHLKHSQKLTVENNSLEKKVLKYSVLHFQDDNKYLQSYFIDQITSLNSNLSNSISEIELENYINSIIDLWRNLKMPSENKIRGLWGELFMISSHANTEEMLKSWHNNYKDKYDFYINNKGLEVKATIKNERIHHFRIKQIEDTKEKVIISSILLQESSNGKSLNDLKENIEKKIGLNKDLLHKLKINFYESIGTYDPKKLEKYRFDFEYSINNIKFYDLVDIPSISNIPNNIINIEFDINFSNIIEMDINYNEL